MWKLPRYILLVLLSSSFGGSTISPPPSLLALFGLKKWMKRIGQSNRTREDEYLTDVSSDYIDICYDLMKPYIYLLPTYSLVNLNLTRPEVTINCT